MTANSSGIVVSELENGIMGMGQLELGCLLNYHDIDLLCNVSTVISYFVIFIREFQDRS